MIFFESSAKTGMNVDEAFMKMTREIFSKIERGEYDLNNESLGITPIKPISLRSKAGKNNSGGCLCS